MIEPILDCPFCDGDKLGVSFKQKRKLSTVYLHCCIYCKQCNTYGPRVLHSCSELEAKKLGSQLKEQMSYEAYKLWNKRPFKFISADLANDSDYTSLR